MGSGLRWLGVGSGLERKAARRVRCSAAAPASRASPRSTTYRRRCSTARHQRWSHTISTHSTGRYRSRSLRISRRCRSRMCSETSLAAQRSLTKRLRASHRSVVRCSTAPCTASCHLWRVAPPRKARDTTRAARHTRCHQRLVGNARQAAWTVGGRWGSELGPGSGCVPGSGLGLGLGLVVSGEGQGLAWMVVASGKRARWQHSSARSTAARMSSSSRALMCSGLLCRHVCWMVAAHLVTVRVRIRARVGSESGLAGGLGSAGRRPRTSAARRYLAA